jgi:hypothetical protein
MEKNNNIKYLKILKTYFFYVLKIDHESRSPFTRVRKMKGPSSKRACLR